MKTQNPIDQLAEPPIFVVGAARSGTTWVYDILTSHPEVAGVYESWLFTRNSGLGSLFTEAHWPPNRSGLSGLLERQALLNETRVFADRVLSNAIKPSHRFLVEKSPSHLYVMRLIHELYPGSRFVNVVRDGRDVSVSVRSAARSWVPQWGQTFGRSISASARAWGHAVRHAQRVGRELGDLYHEIRYEEIKRDPIGSYRQLFEFCNIPYDEELLQQIFEATDFATNYKPGENRFRRGGRVGDWRTHFNLLDAIRFNQAAGAGLVKTGYEKNRWWMGSFFRKTSQPKGR